MLRALITAYPWDLVDEGIDTVLDRLQGEVGVTGLSLWASVPPVTQLRSRNVSPRVFRTSGGLCFPPSTEYYNDTRCKPVIADRIPGRGPLRKIADACASRGLHLRLIVSAAATGGVAQRHPEMACKNVFDDSSETSICLANPDVQSYLCDIVADVSSNYGPAEVSLAYYVLAWPEAFGQGLGVGVTLPDADRSLLSLCFCEFCHQKATAAGVDVAATAQTTRMILEDPFSTRPDRYRTLGPILADNAPLATFFAWRNEEMSALLGRIKDTCHCDLLIHRSVGTPWAALYDGLDYSIPDGVITRRDGAVELASALAPGARRNELHVPGCVVTDADGTHFVSMLADAVQLGFQGVEIGNYGLLPEAALTPIKQAIRFARRSTIDA